MGQQYNTHKWKKIRLEVLRQQPLCIRCHNMGIVRAATVVDHCIPSKSYESFFDTNNLFGVCTQCHSDITKRWDNFNAHEVPEFKNNYASFKYSNEEYRRDSSGFPLNPELDKILDNLEYVGAKDTRPLTQSFVDYSYTEPPHDKK